MTQKNRISNIIFCKHDCNATTIVWKLSDIVSSSYALNTCSLLTTWSWGYNHFLHIWHESRYNFNTSCKMLEVSFIPNIIKQYLTNLDLCVIKVFFHLTLFNLSKDNQRKHFIVSYIIKVKKYLYSMNKNPGGHS